MSDGRVTLATMTEQEAEVLRVRLTRIWSLKPQAEPEPREEHLFLGWYADYDWNPILSFPIADHIFFNAQVQPNGTLYTLIYNPSSLTEEDEDFEGFTGMLSCHSQQGGIIRTDEIPDSIDQWQFIDEYLDFFRRGLWLSGCDIEASAHEKAEWMQGFSREEVDAWKLKM